MCLISTDTCADMTSSTSATREARVTDATASSHDIPHSRVLSGVAVFCLVFLMVRVTKHAADPLANADTWFHLRIGREFWGNWSIADPGSLSSFASNEWVPTQWSTQMLAASVESRFGLPGVAWLFGLLYLVFIWVTYRMLRSHGAIVPATLATGVVFVAAGSSLSARPQVVSLILFTVLVGVWMQAIDHDQPPWILVPLTWGWATAHGLWTAGVLLGLVVTLGLVLDRRVSLRQALGFFAVPTLSVMAASLTPVGPRLLLSQIAVGERTPFITEWGPTSFREGPAILAAILVAALIVVWARKGQVEWTPLLMLILASAWILTVDRMVAFGVIVIAPLFVQAFTDAMGDGRPSSRQLRSETLALGGAALVCAVALGFAVPQTATAPAGVPEKFTMALSELPNQSAVLVEDHVGSWIEWQFPHLNPVIDGMFDAYPVTYVEDFVAFRNLHPDWPIFVEDSHASVAVLVAGSPLAAAMQSQLGWRLVQQDGGWVYLTAPHA